MKLILAAMLASALIIPAHAEDAAKAAAPAKSSWSDFFKNLKNSLEKSAVAGERKKGRRAQSVAAVRGDDQAKKNIADPNEPGLKGDSRSAKMKKEEGYDKVFAGAVDLIAKDKLEDGLKALEDFKLTHTNYRVEDVNKAIEGAKAMIADKKAAPAAKD